MTEPSQKLASKFLGPFQVISKLLEVVYRLKHLKMLCIHDIFHVSLLKKYHHDTIVGQYQIPLPPIVMPKGNIEWEVHKVFWMMEETPIPGILGGIWA